jgi:hypothetical protein
VATLSSCGPGDRRAGGVLQDGAASVRTSASCGDQPFFEPPDRREGFSERRRAGLDRAGEPVGARWDDRGR